MAEQSDGMLKYLSMDYLRGISAPLFATPEKNSYVANEKQALVIWDGSNAGEFIKGTLGIVSSTMAASEIFGNIADSFYWYVCKCLEPEMRRHANGMGIPHVDGNELKQSTIPIPSTLEQQTIASFLDHETAKIDTLIEKQQQLIALLKEKRQAVISHAVTKGLNPNAKMKDSGVEWLGEVPEGWEVTRAKYVSSIFVPQRHKPELNDEHGIPWVTMEDMKGVYIEGTKKFVDNESFKSAGSKILKAESVIASCVGNFGISSINKIDVIINQQLQAFIPTGIKAEYLREIISNSKNYFELIGTAATLVYVNQQGFENLPVLVPPKDEQENICEKIQIDCCNFDKLISMPEKAIKLLQERRTALISAAVTGKIDVRDWQQACA